MVESPPNVLASKKGEVSALKKKSAPVAPAGEKSSKKRKAEKNKTVIPKSNKHKPARAKTAYLYFCDEHRPVIKSQNPNLSMIEVTTELGKMWKEADENKKAKYVELAKQDKERHTRENEKYLNMMSKERFAASQGLPVAPGPVVTQALPPQAQAAESKPAPHVNQVSEVPNTNKSRKPRKPKDAFALFSSALKKQMKESFTKEAAEQKWNNLPAAGKEPYESEAKEAMQLYHEKLQEHDLLKQHPSIPMVAMPMPSAGMGVAHRTPLITPTQLIDMDKMRKTIKRIAKNGDDVYYDVIDRMRPDTANFGRACQAAHDFIIGHKKKDYKGFLVSLFGLEVIKGQTT